MLTLHTPMLTELHAHIGLVSPAPGSTLVIVDIGDGDAALYLEHADRVHWGAGDPEAGDAGRVLRWCRAEIVAAPVA